MFLKTSVLLALFIISGFAVAPTTHYAAEGNWKMGRIYYRMVCTQCHKEQTGKAIAPASYTKAEWNTYIMLNRHAKGQDAFDYYVSTAYRDSIKAKSKIVRNKKFTAKSPEELMADVHAFVIHGAKDSETPARCN